jgi:hypothetical protein
MRGKTAPLIIPRRFFSSLITHHLSLSPTHPFSRIAFSCVRTRKGASRHKGVYAAGPWGLVCAASRQRARCLGARLKFSPR